MSLCPALLIPEYQVQVVLQNVRSNILFSTGKWQPPQWLIGKCTRLCMVSENLPKFLKNAGSYEVLWRVMTCDRFIRRLLALCDPECSAHYPYCQTGDPRLVQSLVKSIRCILNKLAIAQRNRLSRQMFFFCCGSPL